MRLPTTDPAADLAALLASGRTPASIDVRRPGLDDRAALTGDARTVAEVCGVLLAVAPACGALAAGRLRGRGGRLVAL